jgi:glycerol-3-phosphate dehydrogenase (NAD(P)+)
MVTRYDEGPDVVYAIEQEQHAVASYYRNTIIHFFVNKAIIELALLKTSETEGAAALEVFWSEVDKLRDLFKFEFFYAPTEQFHQQIREELARYAGNWEELLQQGAPGFLQLQNNMMLLASHATLLTFAEAYSVVAELLARMEASESLSEEQCVTKALKLGHQAYLQRRISSPASIGKLLFKNGFKVAEHRKLTAGGGKEVASGRKALAMEIRDVLRRLELIRALNVAIRGTTIMTNLKIGVLGGGSWGTTVASLVTRNAPVTLWARNPETVKEINTLHTNSTYLPGAAIPEKLVATNDIGEAVSGADVVVMGIPSQNFRQVLTEVRQHIRAWVPVISLTKGLELDTHMRMTEIITQVMPGHPVGVLTGPNLAREIMAGQAAASVIAMEDDIIVRELQSIFKSGLFRVYTNNDVIGCELGGVLKNIIAIAVGMGDGQGAGDNTRSALITRGLAEVTRLGVAMGGRAETFAGLAGMGDMIATCTSPQSRNRHVGVELGKGRNMQEIVDEMVMVAEGAKSAPAVMALAQKYGVEMPIASDVYRVLSGDSNASRAFRGLLRVSAGAECEPG